MNDQPRRVLCDLIARNGPSLVENQRRCEALLRDHCAEYRREVNVLVSALRDRVPRDILSSTSTTLRGVLLARLTERLQDDLALSEDAAKWAVESWALAIGVIDKVDGYSEIAYTTEVSVTSKAASHVALRQPAGAWSGLTQTKEDRPLSRSTFWNQPLEVMPFIQCVIAAVQVSLGVLALAMIVICVTLLYSWDDTERPLAAWRNYASAATTQLYPCDDKERPPIKILLCTGLLGLLVGVTFVVNGGRRFKRPSGHN